MILKLATSNLRVHRVRAMLTVAAIALAVSLVVSVTSGYASVYAAAHRMLAQYMGTTDAQITRHNDTHGGISATLIDQIAQDPQVDRADGRLELEGPVLSSNNAPASGRFQFIGIRRPSDTRVESQMLEQGQWFDTSDSNDAVIDQVAASRLGGAKLGDTFIIPGINEKQTFRIVGIVHKPGILAGYQQTIYLPLQTLQKLLTPDKPDAISRIMIDLVGQSDQQAFIDRWRPRLAAIDPNIQIQLSSQNRQEMDKNLGGLHALSYIGGSIAIVAATFIIFSALSMGVSERQRSLAMLRAIGAFRSQLGKLVVCEGIVLAIVGVVVGIPLGILWITILAAIHRTVFSAGVAISPGGILFATVGALISALAASLIPALSAMRASPLEAMTPLARPARARGIVLSAIVGILLISFDRFLIFGPLEREVKFYGHLVFGLPCLMFGFFLLAPLVVLTVERVFAPIIAAMLGLRCALLRQQLSGGVWRAAGTCAALMVGLSILIVMMTQGTSAIQSWRLPDRFPDIFIYSAAGLPPATQDKLAAVQGIRPGELMPIAIASPQLGALGRNVIGLGLATTFLPGATMYFGVDPDKAFDMMDLDFQTGQGDAASAKALLKKGRHIVVTQEFRRLKGLGVGDKLPLKTIKGEVEFTIAGVVWSPGIDVITSLYDLGRQFDQRTAASVFGTLDDAKEYFGVERINFFAANLQPSVDKVQLLNQVKKDLGGLGLEAGDVRHIKYNIQTTLQRLLLLVSSVSFAALAVASLGVTNTIMASIRTRRWSFGILRSIGVTRSQLLRMVLAEAIMLGLAGVILGAAAGIFLATEARQGWGDFLGIEPKEVVIPWLTVNIGIASVMVVAVLASLWPAIHVSRTEPLSLLQAGRAAM
jgi:putative ABC transport system permease protein